MDRLLEKTRQHWKLLVVGSVVALATVACKPAVVETPVGPIDFESPAYTTGSIHNQQDWRSSGAYDQEVDTVSDLGTSPSDFGFGDQSFRISDAVTSGGFGDQTFSPDTVDLAGETAANAPDDGNHSGGVRRGFFEASWSFATAGNPFAAQEGLHTVVSPDRGDGARMSWVEMSDCSASIPADPDPLDPGGWECDQGIPGLQVNFYEYDTNDPNPDPGSHGFLFRHVASGLDRSVAHDIQLRMWFFEGVDNDVVNVCVDGSTCTTGHSWEDYFREQELVPSRPVDSLLFREGGAATSGHDGNGFFIDNVKYRVANYTGAAFSVTGPAQVVEGNVGTTTVPYTVTLSEALPFTTQVTWATANDTATAPSDYASGGGILTFAPGEVTKIVNVTVNGDATDESHETFKVNLSNPKSIGLDGAAGAESFPKYAAVDVGSKSTSIRDDDSTLSVSDGTAVEGDTGFTNMPFTVTINNPSAVNVTVHFQTSNGSAVAPGDYTTKSVNVTFIPGQVSKIVNVSIKGDTTLEANENFVVTLSSPVNATVADGIGAGVITDDD